MPREFFYDPDRPNLTAPPLIYPGSEVSRRIDDDWTVWAFTDCHGMLGGLTRALHKAGLTGRDGGWVAPPRTALVGVGDYIDRGPDSAGVVKLLRRLTAESAVAGGKVVLARGNHEHMLSDIVRGDSEWSASWLANGGRFLLSSYGLGDPPYARPVADELRSAAPTLLDWILSTVPYVVWRDVLFVHAGPVAGRGLRDLDDADLQLWDAAPFLRSRGLEDPLFAGYQADGVRRVVVGHIPQDDGPSLAHQGTTLLLDANACGLQRPGERKKSAYVCLVRIDPSRSLADSTFVLEDTDPARATDDR